ncbi:MAG TPA: hypothetical protein DHU96_30425 [Actinobacteria bacterium]|nr:hypothetical protein [Actinomycetota bacterium]
MPRPVRSRVITERDQQPKTCTRTSPPFGAVGGSSAITSPRVQIGVICTGPATRPVFSGP